MQALFRLLTFFFITHVVVEGNDTKDSVDSSFWPDLGPQYHKDLWKAVNELKQNSSTQQEEISALHKKDTEQQQTLEVQQQSITEQKQKFVDQEQKLSAQQKVLSELPTFCQGRTHYNQWVPYSLTTIGIKVYVNTSHCQFKTVPQYFTSLSGIASHWRTMGATSIYDETANGFTVDLYPGEKNYETGVETLATMPTMKWELNWIGIKSKN